MQRQARPIVIHDGMQTAERSARAGSLLGLNLFPPHECQQGVRDFKHPQTGAQEGFSGGNLFQKQRGCRAAL
jgi:hypothetical protein